MTLFVSYPELVGLSNGEIQSLILEGWSQWKTADNPPWLDVARHGAQHEVSASGTKQNGNARHRAAAQDERNKIIGVVVAVGSLRVTLAGDDQGGQLGGQHICADRNP